MGTSLADNRVRAWQETVLIPTYDVGEPNRHPMFLEKRVYQGSSGAVYPYPVVDQVKDGRHDAPYEAVFLENPYLKIMVLPELGGRVQMALDKTSDYHFIYYNRVIKPALVGLAGPWVSGGIEFNWPQHHRPNTFGPVAWEIARNGDGSCTVWCSEIDRLERTKGMHGLTLYPDKAYLEVRVQLYNRTDLPQTFLWWANPAIHVDENHQSVLPPDVTAVMDHGKRDVSDFPIATGTYYKVDYSPGTDISRYRNIPVPTSYMAYHSDYDFVGSYDHRRQAGMLHVASHHISPGKKQWTWGNGDFGCAWDRQLTDEDGPYIELMCGVYTDNQPDFSWLMPGEQKSFSQYFMPYKGVGIVRNATIDAAVGLELAGGVATIRAYTTSERPGAKVVISRGDERLLEQAFDGSPRTYYEASVEVGTDVNEADLRGEVLDAEGRELVACQSPTRRHDAPQPARAIDAPRAIDSTESLYLAGLHLEQYRHATREPEDYYREALRRDPDDVRNNNALGRLLYRRGRFAAAAGHFRRAIGRMTRHNPNPYDGEPYYNLGLALEAQDEYDHAYDAYYKSAWNAAWQESAYFALARIACRRQDHAEALGLVERALRRNADNHRARHLRIYLLATVGRDAEATAAIAEALESDPFNAGALFEQNQLAGRSTDLFDRRMRDDANSYLELALDYAASGLYHRAAGVLEHLLHRTHDKPDSPLVYYWLADFAHGRGNEADAERYRRLAAVPPSNPCFPNRIEEIAILSRAADANPADARAPYYLGNLWYSKRGYDEAIRCWEAAVARDPIFPTAWRNLGLAYYNKHRNGKSAWEAYNRALELDPSDARVLYELDQLAKRLRHPGQERLERLERCVELVNQRDDLYLERVTLLNQRGEHQAALDALLARRFHPWEGGEGKVPAQFVLAITELARREIAHRRFDAAERLLLQTERWPTSLGEGKLAGIQENNIHYLLGLACRGLGRASQAESYLERAAIGLTEPTSATYYNDQPPEMIYYQGLALVELGRREEARERFERLLAYGREHLDDQPTIDFFAVSLPDFLVFDDDLPQQNEVHCRYMMALGYLGLGEIEPARSELERVLHMAPHHQGAALAAASILS